MKKLMVCIATALMLVTVTPIQSKAKKNPKSTSAAEKESVELAAITNRVNEINAIDWSTMSPSEKREIRKELRALKREATHSGGVYISTGVLVLILVLIIIF